MKILTGNCIEHTRSTQSSGYGQLQRKGKKWLAHRWAWTQANGEIPKGLMVLHHCDNRLCVNVDHLFLGTNQDNVTDMMQKLRHRHGETHHSAKLTDAQVEEIRESSEQYSVIAERFGVHEQTVYRIRKGTRRKSYG